MKIITRFFALIISVATTLSVFTAPSYAESQGYSWYVKRNGNLRPHIQNEQELIYKYDGYFIDKKRSDTDSEKVIYLTFDMGYVNENAESILNTLREEKVTAAFFILDNIIVKNREFVTQMIEDGHFICNHTKRHRNLCNASREVIEKDLTELEDLYRDATGCEMAKYFRFPEGKYSENALSCVKELGYKTVFWSFAYDDWDNCRQSPPEKAIEKIIGNTHNGGVFLFHPTSKTNAKIFKELISTWRNMGYRFGTLDELVV